MNRLITFQDDGVSAHVWASRILGEVNRYHGKKILILTYSDDESLVGTGDDCKTLSEWGLASHQNIVIKNISELNLAEVVKLIQDIDIDEAYWNFPIDDVSDLTDENLKRLGELDVRQTFVYMHNNFSLVGENCKLRNLLAHLKISVHEGYMLDFENMYFQWGFDLRGAFNADNQYWSVCREDSFYVVPRDFLFICDDEWVDEKHSIKHLGEVHNSWIERKNKNTENSWLKSLKTKCVSIFK